MVQVQRRAGVGSGRAEAERELRRAFERFLSSALAVGSATVGQNLVFGSSGFEWVTPVGTSPTLALKAVTVTAPYGVTEHSQVVADAEVVATSKILVGWGACTDSDENGPAAGPISMMAVPQPVDGSFVLTLAAHGHAVLGGPYKLHYLVAL